MEKEFLTYEDALIFKELGYKEKCLASFYTYDIENFKKDKFDYRGKFNIDYSGEDDYVINTDKSYYVTTPLYTQAFRWFRDNYGLDGRVSNWNNELFYPKIKDVNTPRKFDDDTLRTLTEYKTHKEAEEACIKKLIEIVKENL